jgi:hypothetical protein
MPEGLEASHHRRPPESHRLPADHPPSAQPRRHPMNFDLLPIAIHRVRTPPKLCPTCHSLLLKQPVSATPARFAPLVFLFIAFDAPSSAAAAESRGEDRAGSSSSLPTSNCSATRGNRGPPADARTRDLPPCGFAFGLTNVQRRPALVYLFKDDATFRPQTEVQRPAGHRQRIPHRGSLIICSRPATAGATTMRVRSTSTRTSPPARFAMPRSVAQEGSPNVSTFEGRGPVRHWGPSPATSSAPTPSASPWRVCWRDARSRDYNGRPGHRSMPPPARALPPRPARLRNQRHRPICGPGAAPQPTRRFQRAFGQAPAEFETAIRDRRAAIHRRPPDLSGTRRGPAPSRPFPRQLDFALGRLSR